ncbi:MAG: ribosome silencing factor [Lachnospiraceae bacterium]|nr:ribosome silencing factor [Lachnospiraceae bacterium]
MIENKKLKTIIDFLNTKKTSTLKVLDISKISIIADYFIIVSVPSQKNVESLDDEICDLMDKNNYTLRNKEGVHSKWVLIDYNDIVIHLFDDDYKDFYNLDKLWADAEEVNI